MLVSQQPVADSRDVQCPSGLSVYLCLLVYKVLELSLGAARYAGQLLVPAEDFYLWPRGVVRALQVTLSTC